MTGTEVLSVAGAIVAFLVALVQALLAYIYTSNKAAFDKSLGVLSEQNRVQGLDLERLKQQAQDADRHDDRVLQGLDKVNDRIDRLASEVAMLTRRSGSGGSGGPGEYRAVTKP